MSGLENMIDTSRPLVAGLQAGNQARAIDLANQQRDIQNQQKFIWLMQQEAKNQAAQQAQQDSLNLREQQFQFRQEQDAARQAADAGAGLADAQWMNQIGAFSSFDGDGNETQSPDTPDVMQTFARMNPASRRAAMGAFNTTMRDQRKLDAVQAGNDRKAAERSAQIEKGRAQLNAFAQANGLEEDAGVQRKAKAYDFMEADPTIPFGKAYQLATKDDEMKMRMGDPNWQPSQEDIDHIKTLFPDLSDDQAVAYVVGIKNKTARSTVPDIVRMSNATDYKNDPDYAAALNEHNRAKQEVQSADSIYRSSLKEGVSSKTRALAKQALDDAKNYAKIASDGVIQAQRTAQGKGRRTGGAAPAPGPAPMPMPGGVGPADIAPPGSGAMGQQAPAPAMGGPATGMMQQPGAPHEVVQMPDGTSVPIDFNEALQFAAQHPEMNPQQRRAAYLAMKHGQMYGVPFDRQGAQK